MKKIIRLQVLSPLPSSLQEPQQEYAPKPDLEDHHLPSFVVS